MSMFLVVFVTVWAVVALLVTGLCAAAARGERFAGDSASVAR
jgi:hypothetical protein